QGRLVAVHYRRGLGSMERRRGIAVGWLAAHPAIREFLDRVLPNAMARLDAMAAQDDRLREEVKTHARTPKLDALIGDRVQAAATTDPEPAAAFWRRGTPGARAVALAACMATPAMASMSILVEGIDSPRTHHEQWTALRALHHVIANRHPLDADPAVAV